MAKSQGILMSGGRTFLVDRVCGTGKACYQ
jgi:hypothetical protein